jgi:hypothetical protein
MAGLLNSDIDFGQRVTATCGIVEEIRTDVRSPIAG